MSDGRITLDQLKGWLTEFARLVAEHRDELTTLDAAIGDADHGTNMDRGMSAVAGRPRRRHRRPRCASRPA